MFIRYALISEWPQAAISAALLRFGIWFSISTARFRIFWASSWEKRKSDCLTGLWLVALDLVVAHVQPICTVCAEMLLQLKCVFLSQLTAKVYSFAFTRNTAQISSNFKRTLFWYPLTTRSRNAIHYLGGEGSCQLFHSLSSMSQNWWMSSSSTIVSSGSGVGVWNFWGIIWHTPRDIRWTRKLSRATVPSPAWIPLSSRTARVGIFRASFREASNIDSLVCWWSAKSRSSEIWPLSRSNCKRNLYSPVNSLQRSAFLRSAL